MSAEKNLQLIRLLASQPMLTEAEARRELGLPESPPDREDRHDEPKEEKPTVNLTASPVAVA